MTNLNNKISNTNMDLSDEDLNTVSGGLNPQPLPPHPDSFRTISSFFSHFNVNQHFSLPSLSLFRFR